MKELTDKYLITEVSLSSLKAFKSVPKVLKTMGFWKDVLIIIQDIYDLQNERIPDDEKEEIVSKNVELLRYLLKKNNVSPLYTDMVTAGLQVALKHANIRLSNLRIR